MFRSGPTDIWNRFLKIYSLSQTGLPTRISREMRISNILSRKVTWADTPPKNHDRRHLCIWKESICKEMSEGNIAWLPPSPHSVWIKSLPGGFVIFTKVPGTQESDRNQISRVSSPTSKHLNSGRQWFYTPLQIDSFQMHRRPWS